jgi:amidophosphoribosyltransferase
MVDDSIVRGTTSGRVVKLLREAGAKEVHFMISSPPFLFPCYYGTDIKSKEVLIANNHSIEEIRQLVGVDTLGYLDLNDLKQIATCGGKNSFCYACFDGKYSTDIPQEQPVNKYETKINIEEKTKRH